MEINITRFVTDEDPYEFSCSRAERGDNAAQQTWDNATQQAATSPLLTTSEQLDALRSHVKEFGAWDREEIDAWSPEQCNAIFIQLVSGDLREAGLDDVDLDEFDWQEYEDRQEAGVVNSNVFRGVDGEVYYYLGS